MTREEVHRLRLHYLAEMVKYVSKVEELIKQIDATEEAAYQLVVDGAGDTEPWFLVKKLLQDNFNYNLDKGKRDIFMREAEMFAVAAEALRQ